MTTLRARSRHRRKALNRNLRAKLTRSAAAHLAAADAFAEVVTIPAAPVAEGQTEIAAAFAAMARDIIESMRREATWEALFHASRGFGALAATGSVGRRPKAPILWEGADV